MRSRQEPAPGEVTGDPAVRIVEWSPHTFAARVDELMRIYVRAMGYPDYAGTQRGVSAKRHVFLDRFTCRAAITDTDTVIGFGYGYTTARGQWWHDLVRQAIGPEQASEWMVDAFELSELHVLPTWQGYGIGKQVLLQLAGAIDHRAMLLSTPDTDTRAFRLYTHLGFSALRRQYLFPGDARPFAILGARLPLAEPADPQH